ncbi:MAG: BatD family protein [Pseudomonadota bacterium]
MLSIRSIRTLIAGGVTAIAISATAAWASNLEADLDRSAIRSGESVTLILSFKDGTPSGQPDLSALEEDFLVLNSKQREQTSIINGEQNQSVDFVLSLEPKRIGALKIPAITWSGQNSPPLTLLVAKAANPSEDGSTPDLFLEVELDNSAPFVQSNIAYTVRVYDAVGLRRGVLSTPNIEGVVITPRGDDRHFETVLNDRAYKVVERSYTLRPQKSGKLDIPPAVLQGKIKDPNEKRRDPFARLGKMGNSSLFNDPFFSRAFGNSAFSDSLLDKFFAPGRDVRVTSEPISLDVQPRPSGATGWFLPALDVKLSERWDPAPPTFRVGESVNRRLVLQAHGAAAEQLPTIVAPQVERLRQYPQLTEDRTIDTPDGPLAIREQIFSIVPTQAGEITLPEIVVEWWDTTEEAARTTVVPERAITVLPLIGGTNVVSPESYLTETPPLNRHEIETTSQSGSTLYLPNNSWIWGGMTLALILASSLAVGAVLARRQRLTAGAHNEGCQDLHHDQNEAVAALRVACRENDPLKAVQALLAWGRSTWPGGQNSKSNGGGSTLSVAEMAKRLEDPDFAQAVDDLVRCLYAPNQGRSQLTWRGDHFWDHFKRIQGRAARSRKVTRPQGLPALYPELANKGATSF